MIRYQYTRKNELKFSEKETFDGIVFNRNQRTIVTKEAIESLQSFVDAGVLDCVVVDDEPVPQSPTGTESSQQKESTEETELPESTEPPKEDHEDHRETHESRVFGKKKKKWGR